MENLTGAAKYLDTGKLPYFFDVPVFLAYRYFMTKDFDGKLEVIIMLEILVNSWSSGKNCQEALDDPEVFVLVSMFSVDIHVANVLQAMLHGLLFHVLYVSFLAEVLHVPIVHQVLYSMCYLLF